MSGIHAKEWKENDRGLLIELTAGYGHAGYYEAGIGLGGSFSITPCLKLTGRYIFVGYSSRNERERAYVGEQDFQCRQTADRPAGPVLKHRALMTTVSDLPVLIQV